MTCIISFYQNACTGYERKIAQIQR